MRVLQRAVQMLGNERALARYLRVPMPELFMWLRGEDAPPQVIFLRAVDLLIDQDTAAVPPAPIDNPESPKRPDAPGL
jgi:hypothetical protein